MKALPKSVVVIIAIAALLAAASIATAQSASTRNTGNATLVLTGAKIYPSPDAAAIPDGVVVIRNGKIAAVGKREEVTIPRNAKTLNCTGMIVTAGFQNSHVHFMEPKWNKAETQPAPRLSTQLASMFTVYGFTTVVDIGSIFPNTSALRSRIESGEVIGPRIIAPIAILYPPDGLPIYIQEFRAANSWTPDEPATPEAAINIVRRYKGESHDILKLFTGSFVTYQNIKPMPLDVARAAVDEAHKEGRLAFAHPSNDEGMQVAIDAGVDILAHTASAGGPWSPALVDNMKKHNMAVVPTLKLWKYVFMGAPDQAPAEQMLQNCVEQLKTFSSAGGQVLFGTDVGFMIDYDPVDEYVYMNRAGLSPMQILAALTTAPTARFKEDDHRGRVAAGLDADLVVLGSDPAQDVRHFTDVRYTIRQGKIIYPLSH